MCREPGCQRRQHPESPYCDTHRRAIVSAAYRTSREAEDRGRFPPTASSASPGA